MVIISAAGMAAHLGGVLAAHTPLPVIGVPIKSGALKGVDALYSTVMMPPGIPVAIVAIDGARNAGILAAQIIGIANPDVRAKIIALKEKMARDVAAKSSLLAEIGVDGYLEAKGKKKDKK